MENHDGVRFQWRESIGDDDENSSDSTVSDCESGVSGEISFFSGNENLVRLREDDRYHGLIRRRLIAGLGPEIGARTNVMAVHRNSHSSFVGRARLSAFRIFETAMAEKNGESGNAKVIRSAWFSTSSAEEASKIFSHGFSRIGRERDSKSNNNGESYGRGLCLFPDEALIHCLKEDSGLNEKDDESEIKRHMILCRLIVGKPELVKLGSDQNCPSCDEFDSGVDDLLKPTKHIIWSTHMNTCVLPEFVVTFTAPIISLIKEREPIREPIRKPTSPWVPFPMLISLLSKFLPRNSVALVSKHYRNHREKKISRQELIHQVRMIAGDELLISAIKYFREKQFKGQR